MVKKVKVHSHKRSDDYRNQHDGNTLNKRQNTPTLPIFDESAHAAYSESTGLVRLITVGIKGLYFLHPGMSIMVLSPERSCFGVGVRGCAIPDPEKSQRATKAKAGWRLRRVGEGLTEFGLALTMFVRRHFCHT